MTTRGIQEVNLEIDRLIARAKRVEAQAAALATEDTALAADIVAIQADITSIQGDITTLQTDVATLQTEMNTEQSRPYYTGLDGPLSSTSWDGDARSTTAKTLIDLSAVFGVPAGVYAVDVYVAVRDSGSATGEAWIVLGPTNSANNGRFFDCTGQANDTYDRTHAIVRCDANGDIYYQTQATGVGTLDVHIQIHGYWKVG